MQYNFFNIDYYFENTFNFDHGEGVILFFPT